MVGAKRYIPRKCAPALISDEGSRCYGLVMEEELRVGHGGMKTPSFKLC